MPADERVDEVGHAGPAGAHDRKQFVLAGLPGDAVVDAIMLDGSVPEEARQLLVRDGKQHLRPSSAASDTGSTDYEAFFFLPELD
jgi:hypothetical protein